MVFLKRNCNLQQSRLDVFREIDSFVVFSFVCYQEVLNDVGSFILNCMLMVVLRERSINDTTRGGHTNRQGTVKYRGSGTNSFSLKTDLI